MARKLSTSIFKVALLGGLAFAVSGCESTRETFGLNKTAPDEFQVVSRAPLSLPPDFTLRVPDPGAPRPQTGTTTELNLADYFRTNKMEYQPVVLEKAAEIVQAYQAGRCDVFTTDASGLYAERLQMQNPDEHIVLPEIISKEPLGPSVRQGDSQWLTIVKWVHFALLNAEEAGITKANVDQMMNSTNPDIRRILGKEGEFGNKKQALTYDNMCFIIREAGREPVERDSLYNVVERSPQELAAMDRRPLQPLSLVH